MRTMLEVGLLKPQLNRFGHLKCSIPWRLPTTLPLPQSRGKLLRMNPTIIGILAFACTLGGVLVGNSLRAIVPRHHLDGESRETIKIAIGLIATMTALVLGLVTASAKNSFDEVDKAATHYAVDVLSLDRLLARYGPETAEVRTALVQVVESRIEMLRPRSSSQKTNLNTLLPRAGLGVEGLGDGIRRLVPRDDSQRALQSQAANLAEAFLLKRWLVAAGGSTSIPKPFLAILVFWLTITFASFGLFAPRNLTVLTALVVCALSVSSAVFLILEMDGPFDGLIKVSTEPLLYAHAHLNQ